MKEINNIVIYTSIENGIRVEKSTIFYKDGSIQEGTKEDAIKAMHEITDKKNITKDELIEMINKDTFYILSEEEYNEKYSDFLPKSKGTFDSQRFDEAIKRIRNVGRKQDSNDEIITTITEEDTNTESIEVSDNSQDDEYDDPDYSLYRKDNIINALGDFIIETKVGRRIAIGTIAVALGTTITLLLCSCDLKTKSGTMKQSNPETSTQNALDNQSNSNNDVNNGLSNTTNNNDLYNDYSVSDLLNVTNNSFQKSKMFNLNLSLKFFNGVFANKYIETDSNIKAALTYDEMVSLQQAYNDYSKDEIRAYFNGYDIDATEMSNDYKSASLQLMGAYIIETSEDPVDIINIIDSTEGKDFYNKYHTLYLKAKEATGDEQLELVKEFYDNVRKDFPVTEEVREEGISHREDHKSIKAYKLSVIPMIDAAERIFQNLEVDYTLGNKEDQSSYNFMNSIGLCNYADDKFERIETILLGSYEDETNPLFEQYRNAITNELIKQNKYVIDDEHRELSKLHRFQEVIDHETNEETKTSSKTIKTTKTYKTTTYKTTTSTKNAPIPDDEKEKVDKDIEKENEEAKAKALEESQKEQERQQELENKNKEDIQNEIKKDEEELNNNINDINDKVNNEQTPNENNYNGIDFDDNHSNNNGDLDSSVKNITTDGSGANNDLPDPNQTGKEFDKKSETITTQVKNYATYETVSENVTVVYNENYTQYDEDGNPITSNKTYQMTR